MPRSTTGHTPRLLSADTLADSVAILLLLQVLQRAVGFGRGIIFCRWLSPEELGQWEMAFSFLMLAGPAAVLSLHAALGRYLEHYRVRGQVQSFLTRIAVATTGLAALSAVVMWLELPWFSDLIFGRPDQLRLTALLTVCLLAVISQNFISDLFTALRLQRIASGLQVLQTVTFAAAAIGLLLAWRMAAESLVVAYTAACLVALLASLPWLYRAWKGVPLPVETPPVSGVWTKIVPYALSIWLAGWLSSLFAMVDRYMIVHYSGLAPDEALAQVGQYHSSRLAPLLFVTFAGLLGGILTPHLSHDWEAGRKYEVSARLNLILKVFGLALAVGGIAILWVAPLAFDVLFQGKYSGGLAVLPWTLTYCSWAALIFVARTYLNCAERAWIASLAYVAGLVITIGLNFLWLPSFGLAGAVWATAAGNLAVLALVLFFSRLRGMRIASGTCIVCVLPALFCLGPWLAAAAVSVLGIWAACSEAFFSADEKRQLWEAAAKLVHRLHGPLRKATPAAIES